MLCQCRRLQKGGIICLPRLLLQWRELHMKSGRDPGSPRENAGVRPFRGPAYMQLMRLLQDLPKLQDERQILCMHTSNRVLPLVGAH
jgi:hypothetical protein